MKSSYRSLAIAMCRSTCAMGSATLLLLAFTASWALGEESISSLLSRVNTDPTARAQLMMQVRAEGAAAIPELESALDQTTGNPRSVALDALRNIEASCAPLEHRPQLIYDVSWLVRASAAQFATARQCASSMPALRSRLTKEADEQVLALVVDAVGFLGNANDEPVLKVLQDEVGRPMEVRVAAAAALQRLGGAYDRHLLDRAAQGTETSSKMRAVSVLSKINDASAQSAIQAAGRNDALIGAQVTALMVTAETEAPDLSESEKVSRLFAKLEDSNVLVAEIAARLLVKKHGTPENLNRLKTMAFGGSVESLSSVGQAARTQMMNDPKKMAIVSALAESGHLKP